MIKIDDDGWHRSADAIVVAVADRAAELRKADAPERVAVAPPA